VCCRFSSGPRLPVSYMSEGQRVPEDLRPARALELVSAAVRLAKVRGAAADEDLLRRTIRKKTPMASPELNLINNAKLEGLSHPVQVIAVTGGKGGRRQDERVGQSGYGHGGLRPNASSCSMATLGLANADVFLGPLAALHTLAHVFIR